MGKILSGYKAAIVSDIIESNNYYYMFASNPVTPATTQLAGSDDYTSFVDGWQLLFGKRIKPADILPVTKNIQWTTGTVYDRYNNTQDLSDKNFFVVTPTTVGGAYLIYKCIDNNKGGASTVKPTGTGLFSPPEDGYIWRFITSISNADYVKFATTSYIPVYGNTTVQASALLNSGVNVVVVSNTGSGYSSYHNGIVQGIGSTNGIQDLKILQIEDTASLNNDFYTNNGIYIYNSETSDLKTVTKYVSNNAGKFVYVDTDLNVNIIDPGATQYRISPRVVFKTNGITPTKAYSVVNTTSNSINNIVIVDPGTYVTWANVHLESNSIFGTGANVYAIVPPPGGHGLDPTSELPIKGYSIAVTFTGNQNSTIPTEVTYNKIGILKNPNQINNATGGDLGTRFVANTFNALAELTPLNGTVFTVGDTVTGSNTGTIGTVAFSNSTVLMLTGDKTFNVGDGEIVVSSSGALSTNTSINTLGDIYTKNIRPMYVHNLTDITRSDAGSESYKLIIQV